MQNSPVFSPNNDPVSELCGSEQKLLLSYLFCLFFRKLALKLVLLEISLSVMSEKGSQVRLNSIQTGVVPQRPPCFCCFPEDVEAKTEHICWKLETEG